MQASSAQQSHILELQLLDSEVMQANTKLKSLPEIEQLLHIDKRITSANEELAQVKAEADQIALELRRGEVDVETVTDRIKKDELEQLQHEVESLKKRQADLEEIELEIMVKNEAIQSRLNTLTTDLASLETLKTEINQRLTTASTEINLLILSKTTARNEVSTRIEKPLLDIYEKVRTSTGGVGAATLIGDKCGGCNLTINAVEMNRIKALAKDELLRCEECRRILVRI
jgi:predicted  nucleic acid-binding Zn-ribbon protein